MLKSGSNAVRNVFGRVTMMVRIHIKSRRGSGLLVMALSLTIVK
jgi:hypothetical protein